MIKKQLNEGSYSVLLELLVSPQQSKGGLFGLRIPEIAGKISMYRSLWKSTSRFKI